MNVRVSADDSLPEQTVGRATRDNRRAGIATPQCRFGLIQSQPTLSLLLVRAMTLKTGIRQDRPYVPVEGHLPRVNRGIGKQAKCQRKQQAMQ